MKKYLLVSNDYEVTGYRVFAQNEDEADLLLDKVARLGYAYKDVTDCNGLYLCWYGSDGVHHYVDAYKINARNMQEAESKVRKEIRDYIRKGNYDYYFESKVIPCLYDIEGLDEETALKAFMGHFYDYYYEEEDEGFYEIVSFKNGVKEADIDWMKVRDFFKALKELKEDGYLEYDEDDENDEYDFDYDEDDEDDEFAELLED